MAFNTLYDHHHVRSYQKNDEIKPTLFSKLPVELPSTTSHTLRAVKQNATYKQFYTVFQCSFRWCTTFSRCGPQIELKGNDVQNTCPIGRYLHWPFCQYPGKQKLSVSFKLQTFHIPTESLTTSL